MIENRMAILTKKAKLIDAIKKSKNGLTLKEAARILKVSPPEAREFINGIDKRENIECVSCDDILKDEVARTHAQRDVPLLDHAVLRHGGFL